LHEGFWVEFPVLSGRERERRKGKKENWPLWENEIFPRSSRHPSYIKEVSVAGPSDLACPKSPQQTSLCEQMAGYSDFPPFSKGSVSYMPAWRFLNGMLILSANQIIEAN
jgi:hypothetical protein